jgi:D-glycero-D-manno-heptose 1,7-bisphosphate phosphatase
MPNIDEHRWFEVDHERQRAAKPTPAMFLDRDGVLIFEKHYLGDPEQVEIYPGVAEKLESLRRLWVPIVVVTNQSGIGQGFYDWLDYELVHERMIELLKLDKPFTGTYANSHLPSDSEASWRKPNPGMFLQAAADLNIRLEDSVMVGDKCIDLAAAARAGVKNLVHVRTGHGDAERSMATKDFPDAEFVDSLADLNIDLYYKV